MPVATQENAQKTQGKRALAIIPRTYNMVTVNEEKKFAASFPHREKIYFVFSCLCLGLSLFKISKGVSSQLASAQVLGQPSTVLYASLKVADISNSASTVKGTITILAEDTNRRKQLL